MKFLFIPLLAVVSAALGFGAEPPSYPPVMLPSTEVRPLPASPHGRPYVLQIGLPNSDASNLTRRSVRG